MKTTIAKSFSLVLAAILLLTVSFSALAEENDPVAIDKEAFDALIASGPVAGADTIEASQWAKTVKEAGVLRVGGTRTSFLFSQLDETDNGIRGFGSRMSTAFFNLLVPAGDKTTAELLKLFPKCLLVARLEGNSGCNSVSGELSIGAHGFWCENGVIQHPVDGVTLSGNFFDIIQNIVAVGNEYYSAFSTYKVPALAVSNLAVSC